MPNHAWNQPTPLHHERSIWQDPRSPWRSWPAPSWFTARRCRAMPQGEISDIAQTLALSRAGLEQGYYWELITYAWIHSESLLVLGILPLHLSSTCSWSGFSARRRNNCSGHVRYTLLYLGGCIFSVVPFFVNPSENQVLMGASGAAFAILGAMAVLCPHVRVPGYYCCFIPLNMELLTLALLACGLELFFLYFQHSAGNQPRRPFGGSAFRGGLRLCLPSARRL